MQEQARKINKNFAFLVQNSVKKDCNGIILEGSSRSGKTISSVDFITHIGTQYGGGHTINVIKETYNSFKTTLYDDFDKRLKDFGLPSPFDKSKEVITFPILGNKINFIGADKESKFLGASCDFMYLNEMLDIEKGIFDQSEMRCRKFWWGDYNPKVTEHWVYENVIKRDDVKFLHSTFKDNPFISPLELKKILSYEDTEDNRRQGTVDIYKWQVYGLGMRAAMEGLIFPNVTWINEFPNDCDQETYGLDFGYTIDPSVLMRIGVKKREAGGADIYLKKMFYTPTPKPEDLGALLEMTLPEGKHAWADSSDPAMIAALKHMGFAVYGALKPRGSIVFGNSLINNFHVHMVRDPDLRKEQENYKYKEVNGIKLNEPIDKWNHCFDAARYGTFMEFRYWV